ncbi:MAG: decarboxylating 6-phosphogluconate dehydrogenase [SAR202 cluster bacterium]|jgi:6-phosphogluconate dehydrogenase|nr:decarboxylating 6-phosphogluconate dehydrogenase [SAR202 cluster bacterium]|tara:strand:+ start:1229 stop:2134 length:906 start_codon:yes stop_codon:yes gene_type:complete
MELGIIGLGKMGLNICRRLIQGGHSVVVFDSDSEVLKIAQKENISTGNSLEDLVKKLTKPRILWMMVPSGEITHSTILNLSDLLDRGDIIIDGGNSYYKDTQSMADKLSEKGIDFLDVGTSGGIWGLENGYSLMVGGDSVTYSKLVPLFETLAPSKGFGHVGPSGAGHFVKMIHNGIEYGMMQAYAEGFDLLKSKEDFNLDIQSISEIWSHGSVVRSWILELISDLLREDSSLKDVAPFVQDSGEGRWTVQESLDAEVPIPVISSALYARFYSRNKDKSFSAKLLSALRNQFGGHKIFKSK